MRASTSAANPAERNLLFGITALQMAFIDGSDLVSAMRACAADKARPFSGVLVEQGKLTFQRRAKLDDLVLEAPGEDSGAPAFPETMGPLPKQRLARR
jgi:hypothetical protein